MNVAVILTCFNEGAYVEAALASVLSQHAGARISQIVLVDDGSEAGTLAVLDRLEGCDPRLHVLRGPGGWGVSQARNRGVAETSAPLLAFLDADDTWAPEKLGRQLRVLEAEAGLALIYTGYETLASGASSGAAKRVYDLSRSRRPARRYFLHDPPILPSSVLIRRSAFDRVGGFDQDIRVFEDTDFFLRLARTERFKGLPDPLIRRRYRLHSLSTPRPDLMAHHAYIALHAATQDPRLAGLVPLRLAERAAKLGLVAYYVGDMETARRHRATAMALQPLNPRALVLAMLLAGGPMLRRTRRARLAQQERLHGR